MFKKAVKSEAKLRLALVGASGFGKTFSSLAIACHLGQRIAVIDTEHGSASKYADIFDFDVLQLSSFHPNEYIQGIKAASSYDVLIIDSLSHAWIGKDGALEQVDRISKRSQGNSFTAWREVTPLHNQLIEAMLASNNHLIVTLRAKTQYILEANEKNKMVPKKVGMAPIQRDGLEYEFDVIGDLDCEHNLKISKSRCPNLSGQTFINPGQNIAELLLNWLGGEVPINLDNREKINQEINFLLQRNNISIEQAKLALFELFGVRSRQFLSEEQLLSFLDYLNQSTELEAAN